MFELLLTYVSQRPAQFEFWFDLIKEQYLTTFFPDVCKRVGILDEREGTKAPSSIVSSRTLV